MTVLTGLVIAITSFATGLVAGSVPNRMAFHAVVTLGSLVVCGEVLSLWYETHSYIHFTSSKSTDYILMGLVTYVILLGGVIAGDQLITRLIESRSKSKLQLQTVSDEH